eukprot:COSAG01_NODE_946_length_12533_cov_4.570532_11_plen_149_part_00
MLPTHQRVSAASTPTMPQSHGRFWTGALPGYDPATTVLLYPSPTSRSLPSLGRQTLSAVRCGTQFVLCSAGVCFCRGVRVRGAFLGCLCALLLGARTRVRVFVFGLSPGISAPPPRHPTCCQDCLSLLRANACRTGRRSSSTARGRRL